MRPELKRDQKIIERLIVTVYTLYSVMLVCSSVALGWNDWVAPVVGMLLFMFWFLFVRKEFNDRQRATVFTVMIVINLTIYGYFADNILGVIATDTALVALLSLYLYEEVIFFTSLGFVVLYGLHIFVTGKIQFNSDKETVMYVMGFLAYLTVEIAAFWQIRVQKKYLEQLAETIATLEEAERSKDDFLSNISHEIRTPINTIYGFSEMILQEKIPEEVRELTKEVQVVGMGLLNVVTDILDFSELSNDKIEVLEEPYNLSSTINDVINMTIARNRGKGLEIIVDCDPLIPCSLLGDEQKIRRVIMNLVNNAIKYTEKGCIVISVGVRRESYGVNLFVQVKDTGIGISAANLEKIFDSFSQVDSTRTRRNGGIGLGLPISKAIIDRMGGFINIKSKEGVGTEISFVVPQKVLDERPMVSIENAESLRIISYFNLAKYSNDAIKEGYAHIIKNMVTSLNVAHRTCNNLAELKHRLSQGNYTHVFIGSKEYSEDKAFFDSISESIRIILISDSETERPKNILTVRKPVYCLSVASVLNGGGDDRVLFRGVSEQEGRFIAPEVKVLVVDDNIMNLKVVEGLLRPYRIAVRTATSGLQALEMIESMDYDFVFMDHMMPEMDGVECFKKIRQKPGVYYAQVPVIALTANAIAGAREMFLREGFADFVSKPIELSMLERVLRRFIPAEKMVTGVNIDNVEFGEERAIEARMLLRSVNAAEKLTEEENYVDSVEKQNVAAKGTILLGMLESVGIDTSIGIQYCAGDEDFYIETLRIYNESSKERLETLPDLFEREDWKNYTVAVHAAKSSSATVGVLALSDEAKQLEVAGKSGDVEYIKTYHEIFMRHQREIVEAIRKVIG